MTTEEKAKELIEEFMYELMAITNIADRYPIAKACALICAEEILQTIDRNHTAKIRYWQQVKEYLTMEENKK